VRRYISVVSIRPCAATCASVLRLRLASMLRPSGERSPNPESTIERERPAGPLTAVAPVSAGRAGRGPLRHPTVAQPSIAQPVVHPIRPAMPELEGLRRNQIAAPEPGMRDRFTRWPALFHARIALLQLTPRPDHSGLLARPRRELGAARPGAEVS